MKYGEGCMCWWWRETALLGTELDEVLEGDLDATPLIARNAIQTIDLPPLTAAERAEMRREEQARIARRVKALVELERRQELEERERSQVEAAAGMSRRRDPVLVAAAARAAALARVARENAIKRARVREVLAQHETTQRGAA